ncbi:hypothetical protein TRFO_25797 [Tritrichomonas foetus]|uniref:Suppressor of forked domain-containing protein n=1 Tax=Tritrichomonas foetus TaxID=1144522 RepID=A0A1J4K946_9EUKA|nr:hypothetical protein TRFO_25797 [Tritrichomonas foetus]|eukprot:OHT06236.1 hypothetical protein TRFO_25797 [Tritrichomonas foetus]
MNQELFDRIQPLIKRLEEEAPMSDERRALFEEFFTYFETYPSFWLQYIREELAAGENDRALKLFYRCLPNVPDVELFLEYLNFVHKTCTDRRAICAAYEYAIANVGRDIGAIPIYNNYVDFADSAGNEIVPLDKLRRVYQRALLIPMDGLMEFHQKYKNWEYSKSMQLAQQLLPEQERHFKATATVYHAKKRYQKQLQCTLCTMDDNGFDYLHRWRLFIEYEKTNPLASNPETYRAYVVYAYKCALMSLRYCSILWHEYAQFLVSIDDSNEAISIYSQAIKILPDNLMLHFTFAELLESRKRASEAFQVYRSIIERSEGNPNHITLSTIQFLKFLQRTEGPIAMRKEFITSVEHGRCTYHLFLAIASIENSVNVNREAALRILNLGLEKHGTESDFLESAIRMLIKMGADEEVIRIMNKAKNELPMDKMLEMYKILHSHLLFCRGKEQLLHSTEEEIVLNDPSETQDKMTLRQFYLPTDFHE